VPDLLSSGTLLGKKEKNKWRTSTCHLWHITQHAAQIYQEFTLLRNQLNKNIISISNPCCEVCAELMTAKYNVRDDGDSPSA